MSVKFDKKKNITHAVKISLAAIIAILLAEALHLQFAVSAGIVAILSVAFTKRETIQTARNRFIAFALALIIAAVCFNLFGYSHFGFFVYLIMFIVICQFMGWNSAMAMDSVLISHFLTLKNMGIQALSNEIALFIIGVGIGIFSNLFLHKDTDYMAKMKQETDALIKQALHRMSLRIMNPQMVDYDGSCFETLRKTITEASAQAHANYMNQLSKDDVEDIEYIAMRDKQSDILYEMYKHLCKIETVPVTAELLSDFFERVSTQYSMENTVEGLLNDFRKLDRQMKEMPLPVQRKEFEDRARLFTIMRGMEEFLNLKKEYMMKNDANPDKGE
ncbi:MAG: hypothetical protein K6G30_04470 [Acetatifactor sp.]|nr:hypothetical protein [Acetatifactor sp.]